MSGVGGLTPDFENGGLRGHHAPFSTKLLKSDCLKLAQRARGRGAKREKNSVEHSNHVDEEKTN